MSQGKAGRYDRLWIGFLSGMVLPLVIFMVIYYIEGTQVTFSEYLRGLWHLSSLIKLLSLCVIGNLLIFWFFIKNKLEISARGVLGATIFYAFLVMISGFFR